MDTQGLQLKNQQVEREIKSAYRSIFADPIEETKAQRARRILKGIAVDIPDEQLEVFVAQMQLLIDSWFDLFEKEAFEGLTLREVLKGD